MENESLLGAYNFIRWVQDYHSKEHGSSQAGMIVKQ